MVWKVGVENRSCVLRNFPLPCEDVLLLECDGSWLVVNLLVETTGVTDNLSRGGSSPQRGLGGATVAAGGAFKLAACYSCLAWFDDGAVYAVGLVVKTAGVAEVVSSRVTPPEGRGGDAAVDALVPRLLGGGKGVR